MEGEGISGRQIPLQEELRRGQWILPKQSILNENFMPALHFCTLGCIMCVGILMDRMNYVWYRLVCHSGYQELGGE